MNAQSGFSREDAKTQRECENSFASLRLWVRFLLGLVLCVSGCSVENERSFNILNYGAHANGRASSTEAIRAAIAAARSAGGGTVVVPPGDYVCGPIELTSNLVFDIEAGAVLHFPAARLPYAWGRQQGIECLTPVPLIGGEHLENVAITGRGLLTTDNAAWLDMFGRPTPKSAAGPGSAFGPEWNHLLDLLQQQTPQPREEYLKVAPFLRPAFIRFTESRNISIQNIRIAGSPFWTIHALYCQNVDVRGVSLETFPGAFTGGIYIDSTRDARISNCYLDNGDDAITLKAGKDADGLRVNRPTENVTIENCLIHRGSGAIVLGSETSGGIRNVTVSNVICQGTQMGINIKTERGRGGTVENVRISNVVMDDVGKAISVSEFYTMQGEIPAAPGPVTRGTPVFRNISIDGVTINHARGAPDYSWNPVSISGSAGQPLVTIDIEGLPEMPIAGLRISNVTASGKTGLRASNAAGLELRHIQMDAAGGPAFAIHDCKDLELDGVTTAAPNAGAPVIRLGASPGAVVRNCRAYSGTGTFLSTPPGELKDIVLENNVLLEASHPTEESAGGI
jgi:polygalacturonase